jgi:propionyl-CoA carboxylase alpha chain
MIVSPMPGSLISLAKGVGDEVEAGDEIAVVEAMKMRNVLKAERAGRIKEVLVQPGAVLAADQVLVRFE